MSLLELGVVATILSILAAVVVMRNGRTLLGNFGAQGEVRSLAIALSQAKRRAITGGNTHGVVFNVVSSKIASYSVVSVNSGNTVVDGPYTLPVELTVTSSHTQMNFDFTGQAAATYWVLLTGANRQWRIDIVPVTGAINVTQVM